MEKQMQETMHRIFAAGGRMPDEQQMQAIMDDGHNLVVKAGAGSGKTMVLSYRFARLVAQGKAHADQILALTFTNKAASEMMQRIRTLLLGCSPMLDEEYARLGQAMVCTIDSFCTTVARQGCTRWGIDPSFSVDNDAAADICMALAMDLLEQERNKAVLQSMASLHGPMAIAQDVLVPYAMQYFTPCTPPMDVEGTCGRYGQLCTQALAEALQDLGVLQGMCNDIQDGGKTLQNAKEALQATENLQKAIASCLWGEAEAIARSISWRKVGGKGASAMPGKLLNDMCDRTREAVDKAVAACAALQGMDVLRLHLQFLGEYQQAVAKAKAQAGIVTYADCSHMAVQALLCDASLRSRYKQAFKYVMVDEAQDDNPLQHDLLMLLCEDQGFCSGTMPSAMDLQQGKLLAVGDEKQSIYQFRAADVSVFKALGDAVQATGGKVMHLQSCYRTDRHLVDTLNTLFQGVFSNASQPWDAQASDLSSVRDAGGGRLTLLAGQYPQPSTSDEAQAIATLVQDMLQGDGYPVMDNGQKRRPRPSDIAILMRASTIQGLVEQALADRGIPCSATISCSLFCSQEMADLYRMMQCATYPSDKGSWHALLGTRSLGISAGAQDRLAKQTQAFQGCPPWLDDADRQGLEKLLGWHADVMRFQGGGVQAMVRAFFAHGNYLQSQADTQQSMRRYQSIRAIARHCDEKDLGIAGFLDIVRPHMGSDDRLADMPYLMQENNGVSLMTIHKSKGLEFPIVIVAGCGSAGMQGGKPYCQLDAQVAIAPHMDAMLPGCKKSVGSYVAYAGLEQTQDRAKAELKRILYVACTRAKDHLVVSGTVTKLNHGPDAQDKNLLYMYARAMGVEGSDQVLSQDDMASFGTGGTFVPSVLG